MDLTRVLAGPLCGMLLGDLGADVIKVEHPGSGDATRGYGPPFDERGESAYFLAVNRNKKSIALDLSAESDRALLLGLLQDADVVIDNFIPGALNLAALALDPKLNSNAGRVENCDQIVAAIDAVIAAGNADEWIERLQRAGVPCGEVRTVAEALQAVGGSPLTGVTSSAEGKVRLPPPRLDEHGAELRASGWRAFER